MKQVVVGVLATVGIVSWLIYQDLPDARPHLIFCDVGQGDATLITQGTVQMLVDGGPDDSVLSCLEDHMPFWDRQIELIVATHPDADHITGLASVLRKYQATSILTSSLPKETADFESFKTAVEKAAWNQAKIIRPSIGQQITLSDRVRAVVLYPQEVVELNGATHLEAPETLLSDKKAQLYAKSPDKNDYNNWSIVLFCTLDDVGVLLTGDLEKEGEAALLAAGLTPEAEILKVGHHGSKSSSTTQFLDKIQPEVAVVSVGKKNRYHHPADEVLDRLDSRRISVLRTDQLGTVELVVDGGTYRQVQR